ncbi:MAG: RdgB/HAM1 family non-canonical purine NTP pyrophosphatase [Candidatus Micrarchaeota archaeon]|nr:RdgB/HAM1 family non-canonical purine NTP pyrophosphatase [Candidatus Micrarchaeota archaeon]MDE1833800.1 RdgB/HAM1 family non-canonical purine NTP pyrophosphatase [Candidatus Micrarchaeota archaeon]MDE1859590.1 RdgB/HAM1 family non-canonical purine NTP pyrophosphatase [Candidatus Micrarchaeota archaeon]
MKIVFVTSNKNKAAEVSHILGINLKVESAELPELQSLSVEENARHKAYEAHRLIGKPVIVEDTGLYIKGFNGFPGALIKWYMKGVGYEGICRAVDRCTTRGAYGETCIAFYDGNVLKTFTGRIHGSISKRQKGSNNFGWDHIFIPKGYSKTFAEMSMAEKSKISMRAIAVKKLKLYLNKNKLI